MQTEPERRQSEATAEEKAQAAEAVPTAPSRRGFLCSSARRLAYVAPMVLLFRPNQACAASQSQS